MLNPPAPSSIPPTLDGRRVAVVGSGDALARVLALLHRQGAACRAITDPYRAAAVVATTPGFSAVVIALPSIYPEEVSVIGALHRLSGLPVLVAADDGMISTLSASIREGAAGILTERGIDWLAHPAPQHTPPTASPPPTASSPPSPPSSPTPSPTSLPPGAAAPQDLLGDLGELADDGGPPPDPVLSAEELRALLQDPLPATRGTTRTAPNPRWT